ncbi:MAG TPA: DUF362 domain-containing protein [Candidatus Hydrogenedentes bacterium]|nr:DUF362 domain-containing protein [Candidatus Hydrogenedentota bacterium]
MPKKNDTAPVVRYETHRYVITEENGCLLGQEKECEVLTGEPLVLVQPLKQELEQSVQEAFDRIDAQSVIHKGDSVAIKINLGGGIHHVPTTYSDPVICEAIINVLKRMGARPFVCEADMRAHTMHEQLLKARGYSSMLQRNGVEFVNLSQGPMVRMTCRNLDIPLLLPEILLKPGIRIVSFAPPKHHWECGITGNQKNMYGAIGEPRKSIYHRKFDRIDKAVAAASRIMAPGLNILAGFHLGGGLGPHFCFPVPFNRMIISKDMIRGDKAAAEILGYPFDQVEYANINAEGKNVEYILHPDSDWPDQITLAAIKKNSLTPRSVRFWKHILYPQYFVPHGFQRSVYPSLEFVATWINQRFFHSPQS